MAKNERDALRDLNWQSVYAEVPECVYAGVTKAYRRIRQRKRRSQRTLRMTAVAAGVLLVAGAGLLALNRGGESADRVASPQVQSTPPAWQSTVYTSMQDPCYHLVEDCTQAQGEQVAMLPETAMEFEKQPCSVCASGERNLGDT